MAGLLSVRSIFRRKKEHSIFRKKKCAERTLPCSLHS